jgi:hypothetical protein
MIKNDKQLRIAEKKLQGLANARQEQAGEVSRRAYSDLIHAINVEIAEYRDVKGGAVRTFNVDSLDAVGDAIIRARISRGWTQREFAEALGVS